MLGQRQRRQNMGVAEPVKRVVVGRKELDGAGFESQPSQSVQAPEKMLMRY
jgi:hypothetical protein